MNQKDKKQLRDIIRRASVGDLFRELSLAFREDIFDEVDFPGIDEVEKILALAVRIEVMEKGAKALSDIIRVKGLVKKPETLETR